MNYKILGRSDLKISTIGFGCMSLKNENRENEKVIHEAIERGINYFDTADLYEKGMNEELVGKALSPKREKVVLATKVGNQWRKDGWDWNPKKEYILAAVDESLRRLKTDYIDLYQLHGGTMEDPFEESIDAFETLVKKGKIRYYGISSIRPNVIKRYIGSSNIVSVMMQYSLLDRRPEEVCLPLLHQYNIGVLARGSVAGGLLVNKPGISFLNYTLEEVNIAAKAIRSVVNKERSAAQSAIQFVLNNPAITSAVIGIRTFDQLEEAVNASLAAELTLKEMNELCNVLPIHVYTENR